MIRTPRIRLPTPATHSYSRHHPPWWTRKVRVRRLAAFLGIVFLLFIFWRIAFAYDSHGRIVPQNPAVEDMEKQLEALTRDKAPAFSELMNLVIVTGHAIWLGGKSLGLNDTEWNLAPGREGEGRTYVQHIEAGVKEAVEDGSSLLVFSGGETDPDVGPRSEAQSYFDLAHARGLIPQKLLPRVTTEFIALDSYQNLLYSIARFHEYTSNYPSKITLVSHDFKKERFTSLHLRAIGFPESRFKFVGIDPPAMETPALREKVIEGENKNGILPWSNDPYACDRQGPLAKKREQRGWSRRTHGYWDECPELRGLLTWCEIRGTRQWFDEKLPWN